MFSDLSLSANVILSMRAPILVKTEEKKKHLASG